MTHYEQTVYSGDKPIGRIMPISDKEFRRKAKLFYQELERQIKAGKYKRCAVRRNEKTGTGSDLIKVKEIADKERETALHRIAPF